jgi:hypothetical protein
MSVPTLLLAALLQSTASELADATSSMLTS